MSASAITLRIDIAHDHNLPLDAAGMAAQVAMALQQQLKLGWDAAVSDDTRHVSAGPVMVTIQSAAITRWEEPRQTTFVVRPE